MRGRKPKPIEEKIRTGNPGKRALGRPPAFQHLRPEIPASVTPAGRKWLAPILDELARTGVLTVVDGSSLAAMADAHLNREWWARKIRSLQRKPKVDWDQLREAQREYNRADDAERKWATEYGLTAVSRTRLAIKDDGGGRGDDDESDLDP